MSDFFLHSLSALLVYPISWTLWVLHNLNMQRQWEWRGSVFLCLRLYGLPCLVCCVGLLWIYLGFRGARNIHLIVGPHSLYSLPQSIEELASIYLFLWIGGVIALVVLSYFRADKWVTERTTGRENLQ